MNETSFLTNQAAIQAVLFSSPRNQIYTSTEVSVLYFFSICGSSGIKEFFGFLLHLLQFSSLTLGPVSVASLVIFSLHIPSFAFSLFFAVVSEGDGRKRKTLNFMAARKAMKWSGIISVYEMKITHKILKKTQATEGKQWQIRFQERKQHVKNCGITKRIEFYCVQ